MRIRARQEKKDNGHKTESEATPLKTPHLQDQTTRSVVISHYQLFRLTQWGHVCDVYSVKRLTCSQYLDCYTKSYFNIILDIFTFFNPSGKKFQPLPMIFFSLPNPLPLQLQIGSHNNQFFSTFLLHSPSF